MSAIAPSMIGIPRPTPIPIPVFCVLDSPPELAAASSGSAVLSDRSFAAAVLAVSFGLAPEVVAAIVPTSSPL